MWNLACQGCALTLAELGAGLQDRVRGRRVVLLECAKDARREPTRARPELDNLAAGGDFEDRRDLRRERRAVQRRHLRRGDEVPRRAELRGARRVITERRCKERELHVAAEG